MAKASKDKDANGLFDLLDEMNPFASYMDDDSNKINDWIDTGSLIMNAIISGSMYKGIPVGRCTLLAGESGVGKSYMAMKIIGNAQKKGMKVLLFDTENATDDLMVMNLGADPSKIKNYPPRSIEDMKNAIYAILKKIYEMEEIHRKDPTKPSMFGKVLIVIDSLANVVSELELKRMDKESTSADMGTKAKAIRALLTMATSFGKLTGTTFLVTNHIYDNPTEMYPDLVKNMSGGKASRYLPHVVLQLAKRNLKEKDSGEEDTAALGKGVSGIEMRGMCVKNRIIRPLLEGSLYLSWAHGLDHEYGLLDLAIQLGVIERHGATYSLTSTGESLGYAKTFKKDKELWKEKIYPEIERLLAEKWSYQNSSESIEVEPPGNDDEQEDGIKPTDMTLEISAEDADKTIEI